MPKLAAMGFRAFLVMDNKVARQVMAENGRKMAEKWVAAGKWQEMDFRVFCATVFEVARQASVSIGKHR